MTPTRLRRAAVAAERAVAADPRGARSVRPPLPDGRADAAGARRQDRAIEQVQSGICHARVPVGRDRRHGSAYCAPTASTTWRAFEREALARIGGMPREVAMRHRLPHFDHLFGNDWYSAGYYSYLWSDVMAADAWQAFVEAGGPWDAGVNERLAHAHPVGRQLDRSRRSLSPIPRPRSGHPGAPRRTWLYRRFHRY